MKTSFVKFANLGTIAVFALSCAQLHAYDPAGQRVGLTAYQSEQIFETEPLPKAGSPNVVFIVLDDVGFSDLGSYGSEISTPNMDNLARNGLRYTNFHTRAICSPTRAALLTGRNSHTVGVGTIASMANGFPSGRLKISNRTATLSEILQDKGYRTFAVGKWHLSPLMTTSSREFWPLRKGFDQFYGFLDGMTDQYTPDMIRDNSIVDTTYRDSYHLSEDLVNRSIEYIAHETSVEPERPFFLYLAFGAGHAPHQVPKRYVDKYIGIFEKGWDKTREDRLVRQKKMGLLPANAVLPAPNPGIKSWTSLSEQEKRVFTRYQALYAGFLEHTDEQIGRLVDFLKKAGCYENTIFVLISDNGGSTEGGYEGTLNEFRPMSGRPETIEEMDKQLAAFGNDTTNPNYPMGWTQASNTPFRFYKITLWDGGTRAPMIVSWNKGITNNGGIRKQFVDVIDIAPTVMDITGIFMPEIFKGVPQVPVAGASIRKTFNDPNAPAPRDTQYFELAGQRAIYHQGWKAVAEHQRGKSFYNDRWYLFDTVKDPTTVDDLSATKSELLEELKALWWVEAAKYGALALLEPADTPGFVPRTQGLAPTQEAADKSNEARLKNLRDERAEYVFYPEAHSFLRSEGPIFNRDHFIVNVELSDFRSNDEGVLVSAGDQFGGYSLYMKEGELVFAYNDVGDLSLVRAKMPRLTGSKNVEFRFDRHSSEGGLGTLTMDGQQLGTGDVRRPMRTFQPLAGFNIGRDANGHASPEYRDRGMFQFREGVITKVVVRNSKRDSGTDEQ